MKRTDFIALCLESMDESGYFAENEVSYDEMRQIINDELDKMHIGAEMEPLDDEDLDRILMLGIDKGVDNTLTSLHQKGLVSLHIMEGGIFGYELTKEGERAKSSGQDKTLLKILQQR